MLPTTFPVGARVRAKREIDVWPYCVIPAGSTGTVNRRDAQTAYEPAFSVRLDAVFPDLAEWANCVFVWRDDDPLANDAVISAWELDP